MCSVRHWALVTGGTRVQARRLGALSEGGAGWASGSSRTKARLPSQEARARKTYAHVGLALELLTALHPARAAGLQRQAVGSRDSRMASPRSCGFAFLLLGELARAYTECLEVKLQLVTNRLLKGLSFNSNV